MSETATPKRAGRPRKVGPPIRQRSMAPFARADMGPAMRALPNTRWREACLARFEVRSNADAVRLAGLGGARPATAKRVGHALFHDPRMLAALHEIAQKHVKAGTADALGVVREVLIDQEAPPRDRLAAARIYLDRSLPVVALSHSTVERTPDTIIIASAEVLQRIRLLAVRAGLDPARQLELADGRGGSDLELTAEEVRP
jgi:hypothetical protein